MPDSNYIKIYSGDSIRAHRIASELEKSDIIPVLKDQTDSGLLPIFGASNSILKLVYVHKDEFDKAKNIVENLSSELQE
ncbi:putative signal transducing protein [Algibacter sp. R77976]|uniref:putative signal transducing protein n=1 Tax=Algibacter sp. R77976 TaxID=3093873 RepID=UPI0037C65AED